MADTIKTGKFPSSAKFIIGNEAAERFTFYGMKAVLTTYLASQFFLHEKTGNAHANELTHTFIAMTYLMSIIGGIIADSYIGKYRTILTLSLVYAAGNFMQAFCTTDYSMFMIGLLLITLGAGGIKPCVSANVGDQFDHTNQHLLSKMFGYFYIAINVGSVGSTLLTPILITNHPIQFAGISITGPMQAFGLPGALMLVATFIFWLGRKRYVRVPPKKITRVNFLNISFQALGNINKKQKGQHMLDTVKGSFPEESVENTKAVWRVLAVFAFIPVFWALYDQNGSEWVLQATKMNLTTNFGLFSITWMPQQIQAINPILIVLFVPLFNYLIYPGVEKLGIKVTPLRKIGAGMVLTALSFVTIAQIQSWIDAGQTPSIGWQVLAYTIITAAEILISITGLEYAYTQAPPSMKSTVMACFLASVFFGDIFDTIVNKSIVNGGFFSHYTGASFYWFFFGLMSAFTILFFLVSSRIKERSYLIDTTTEAEAIDRAL